MQNSTIFKKIMKNIAIFASGSGTNAENLIRFFRTDRSGRVCLVLSNNKNAGVIQRAQSNDIETLVFSREQFYEGEEVLNLLRQREIDFVVLAGFLWLVPLPLLEAYENKVINIHPALLPKYGGKGMYGRHVHKAVIANGEKESGITIHYVNSRYDEGNIVFQARCRVKEDDTPESLASRIHALEYEHFPLVVEKLLQEL
jgi:phosphoribosylglycinamide formyltransferase-1